MSQGDRIEYKIGDPASGRRPGSIIVEVFEDRLRISALLPGGAGPARPRSGADEYSKVTGLPSRDRTEARAVPIRRRAGSVSWTSPSRNVGMWLSRTDGPTQFLPSRFWLWRCRSKVREG